MQRKKNNIPRIEKVSVQENLIQILVRGKQQNIKSTPENHKEAAS